MTPPTAGARLKRARELAGVARRALDRRAGRPEGQCKLIEDRRDGAGQETIHPDVARGYASALKLRVEWLSLGIAPMVDGIDDGDEDALRAHLHAAAGNGAEVCDLVPDTTEAADVATDEILRDRADEAEARAELDAARRRELGTASTLPPPAPEAA